MKSPVSVLFAASLLLCVAACGPKKQQQETVVPVAVMDVKDMQSSFRRGYIGTVVSKHTTVLVSPYGGPVVKLPVHRGQKIKDGEHLGGKMSAEDDFADGDEDDFLD